MIAGMLKKFVAFFLAITFLTWVGTREFRRPDLTIIGYVNMAEGLGRQSVELIDALKGDLKIDFIPTKKSYLHDVPKSVVEILNRSKGKLGKVVIFEECLWVPDHNHYLKLDSPRCNEQIRIAYSMFESTRIPQEWTEILNTYFDAVCVPDTFHVEAYAKSGVAIPIFVLPLGLDLSPFFNSPDKHEAGTPFVFGNLSTCLDRKNHLTLLRAFHRAFGNNPNVQLCINSRYGEPETIAALKEEILKLGLTNVLFSQLDLDKASYLQLFQSLDCYVSLSKGEGFSIQPREALALGMPAIVTDNTAQSTLCKSGHVIPIASTSAEPARYWWGATYGHSFTCKIEDATQALVDAYHNFPKHKKSALEGREWVKQYQYEHIKPLYKTLVRPKKVLFGSKNDVTETTLMTNSQELYTKYKKLIR